jgi:hypothetical protein
MPNHVSFIVLLTAFPFNLLFLASYTSVNAVTLQDNNVAHIQTDITSRKKIKKKCKSKGTSKGSSKGKGTSAPTVLSNRRRKTSSSDKETYQVDVIKDAVKYRVVSGFVPVVAAKAKDKAKSPSGIKKTKSPSALKKTKSPSALKKTKSPSHIIDCEEVELPSYAPSISLSPSVVPSSKPSFKPTTSSAPSSFPTQQPSDNPSMVPSTYPSLSPTISHQPSTTQQPSASTIPSTMPSEAYSPWCNSIDIGVTDEVPTTAYVVEGTYAYEMEYENTMNLSEILEEVDNAILQDLIKDHIWCGNKNQAERSRSLGLATLKPGHVIGVKTKTNIRNNRRSLLIDGISLDETDVVASSQCRKISPGEPSSCQIFDGSYTLYLREHHTLSERQAKDDVLRTIKSGMDTNEENNIAHRVKGVEDFYYLGEEYDENDSSIVGQNGEINGLESIVSSSLSALGVLIISLGSVVTILFVYAATRKKDRYKLKRMEEFFEEEESLFGKGGIGLDDLDTEIDLMSTDSGKRTRNIEILGDEHSRYSSNPHDTDIYAMGGALRQNRNGLGRRDNAVNVHKCTSATCHICSHNLIDPTFVRSIYPDTVDMNMANAKERNYSVPDTVEM